MISLAQAAQAVQRTVESHPAANWFVIGGSALAAWIQPIAGVVAIVWGGLQIYLAIEKRWFRKDK